MDRSALTRLDEYQWEVPVSYRASMRVPVRLFASEALVGRLAASEAVEQALIVAALPGLVGHLVVMPDACAGRAAPFGMVAAMKESVGLVVPEAIGHDVGSGVRLLGSSLDANAALGEALEAALRDRLPVGADAEGALSLRGSEVDHVARSGAQWALRQQMAEQDDLVRAEEGGRLNEAAPDKVSAEARALGARQLGTLGGGEHFVEVGVVEEVFHRAAALTMGLSEGTLAVQIHSGSRGYGRQVCADYIARFREQGGVDGLDGFPAELAAAPLEDAAAQDYLGAMRAAANYAYANRQVLAHRVREAFDAALDGSGAQLRTVYDVAHNLGQIEVHDVEGKHVRCCMHRKGAARAFGPGTPGISLPYRALGQPVLVPGRRGGTSWVLLGTQQNMERSFGSACHGDGQALCRHEHGQSGAGGGAAAEAPVEVGGGEAVDVQEALEAVVETVAGAGLARRVARIRPVAVVHA